MGKRTENWFILSAASISTSSWSGYFFVTKHSFFSIASPWDKVLSLAVTPLFPLIPGIAAIVLVGALSYFMKSRTGRGGLFALAACGDVRILSFRRAYIDGYPLREDIGNGGAQ
jgi:hypothetical protein